MEISPSLYPDEAYRFQNLAEEAARKAGFDFPLPVTVEQLTQPCPHFRVLAAAVNGMQTCVLVDGGGHILNIDSRPLVVPPKRPWWKRLLGIKEL